MLLTRKIPERMTSPEIRGRGNPAILSPLCLRLPLIALFAVFAAQLITECILINVDSGYISVTSCCPTVPRYVRSAALWALRELRKVNRMNNGKRFDVEELRVNVDRLCPYLELTATRWDKMGSEEGEASR